MPDDGQQIRDHLDAAHAAAERLLREAEARAREQTRDVPPRGWDVPDPGPEADASRPGFPELSAIVALLENTRASIPPEITVQLAEALRELLVAVRALLDWYIARLDAMRPGTAPVDPAGPSSRVQDIPIQ